MSDNAMREIANRIKDQRIKLGFSFQDLANLTNMSKSTLQRYETGGIKNIPLSKVKILAKALNTTPEWIMGWNEPIDHWNYSEEEGFKGLQLDELIEDFFGKVGRDILEDLRNLNNNGLKEVEKRIEELTRLPEYQSNYKRDQIQTNCNSIIELDFSYQPASAGTGIFLDDENMGKNKVVLNRQTARADFCVPVSGDSMEPRFHDKDILLVHKQPDVEFGEIGIFILDGSGYVKQRGQKEILSLNNEYSNIPFDESICCCGKVIGILDPSWIVK